MVTVTPEREKLVAFSEPTRTHVSEVVVPGPGAPPIGTLDDLSGQDVFVRKGSIYEESLITLNEQLKARGKPAAMFVEAPAFLEDDDVPRSQHLVPQRRACRAGADRARNGHLRQQHLQVLRHLQTDQRSAGATRSGEDASREGPLNRTISAGVSRGWHLSRRNGMRDLS
jgi:Bacterial extracellular solute-binding proteins, family 3